MQITKEFMSQFIGNLAELTDEQILAIINLLQLEIRIRKNLKELLKQTVKQKTKSL